MEVETKCKKRNFEDTVFTVATVLCLVPIVLGVLIGALFEDTGQMNIHRWWPFSWMFFMFAWSACEIKDVIDMKRGTDNASGDLEDAVETALYINITTIMLLIGIVMGQLYASWLAGPIVFVLFTVIWPLLRNSEDKEQVYIPTIPLFLLIAGIVAEVIVGGWVAFPVSWILISAIKVYKIIGKRTFTEDVLVDITYHSFSIILLSTSLIWGSWIISWLAYPISVTVGKIVSKVRSKK